MNKTIIAEIKRIAPDMAWDEVYPVNPGWFERVMDRGSAESVSPSDIAETIIKAIENGSYIDHTPGSIYIAPELLTMQNVPKPRD